MMGSGWRRPTSGLSLELADLSFQLFVLSDEPGDHLGELLGILERLRDLLLLAEQLEHRVLDAGFPYRSNDGRSALSVLILTTE